MTTNKHREPEPEEGERLMNYGKEKIGIYRTYATPLENVRTIPESSFDGRDNTLLGLDVRVRLEGDKFFKNFKEADNTDLVATDTMKNFVQYQLGEYDGATVEGFLDFTGREFLEQYPQIEAIQLSADQIPFDELDVPTDDGDFEPSELVFRVSQNESGFGEVYLTRGDDGPQIEEQNSGITDLQLVKVKGSSFTDYVQDEHTTLPEREDRTLYISMDIFWNYEDPEDCLGEEPQRYVAPEQVRDIAHVMFDEVYSQSIQDLIYQVGLRVLERFPQLESVNFEANNQTWIAVREEIDGDEDVRVLREPARPTGYQQFSMNRDDLDEQ